VTSTECQEFECEATTGQCVVSSNMAGDRANSTGTCSDGVCVQKCEGIVCESSGECQQAGCEPTSPGKCIIISNLTGLETDAAGPVLCGECQSKCSGGPASAGVPEFQLPSHNRRSASAVQQRHW